MVYGFCVAIAHTYPRQAKITRLKATRRGLFSGTNFDCGGRHCTGSCPDTEDVSDIDELSISLRGTLSSEATLSGYHKRHPRILK